MASNPLKLLSKLRRFDGSKSVSEYLTTEMRQNFKAIEDAFRSIGVQSTDASVNNQASSYLLFANKTASMPTVTTSYVKIANWDEPSQNVGVGGTFDRITGEWTCDVTAKYLFIGRAGLALNSGDEIYLKFMLDGVMQTSAMGFSTPKRGPTVSFSKVIEQGQVVDLRAASLGGLMSMQADSDGPIFFNVIGL